MLLTPLIKRQLRIFAILATVSLGLAFFKYAQVPALIGIGVYDVQVDFADASGLYPKAAVTYRGVDVGEVSSLEVGDRGAVAVLRIDNDAKVPAGASAELHSTSAIGEQYVDLVPPKDAAEKSESYLADGDRIPRDRAIEMPQISPVLDSVNRLLKSVPKGATQEVLDGVDEGLAGAGPELGDLVDSSSRLIGEAQARIEATSSLIAALKPVLETQVELGDETVGYADSLDKLAGTLAENNSADLRALLDSGPGGLDSATETIVGLQPVLPRMLYNLTTNAQVLNATLPELRQTLVVYPAMVARVQQAVNPRAKYGDVQLDLRATLNNPPTCIAGYLPPRERRSPGETTVRDVNRLAHCEAPSNSPVVVRGARNLPCPNSAARGAVPADCGLRFRDARYAPTSATVAYDLAVGRKVSKAETGPMTKGPAKSKAKGTTEQFEGDDLWKILVLAPLMVR